MDAIILALIASIISPCVVVWITERQRQKSKKEERDAQWAREDEVARRVAEATEALAKSQGDLVIAAAENVSMTKVVEQKVDEVHLLVNSTLTTAIEVARTALEDSINMMAEKVEDCHKMGVEPSSALLARIAGAKARVAGLGAQLAERERENAVVRTQIEEMSGNS